MAQEQKDENPVAQAPAFTKAQKDGALSWFKKAADCRERRDYDYAIECFINGLSFWPEAVDEGHMPLRSLAIQRQQVGGKKPGMVEGLKKPMTGKDARQCMLNAEYLLSKDPQNASYLDHLLKNANKAGLNETVKWAAPLVLDSVKRDKKPDRGRFRAFRDALCDTSDRVEAQGQAALAVWCLEQAVASLDYLYARCPGDEDLRTEQRDLAGKLAILRGKYEQADTFRESLVDADKQKLLHDADRTKQADETYEALVAAARQDLEQNPGQPQKIYALVDVLLRREARTEENEAIAVLMQAHQQSRNYSFKLRADDIRLRQLHRQTRQTSEQARRSGSDEDEQQARLARMEQLQAELEIYRERAANYPTDLRVKYNLGRALFRDGAYDEAIPVLQAAQADPRSRYQCSFLIGRAFFEKSNYSQASAVLTELLNNYELTDDLSKEAAYWLGRSLEAEGKIDEAKATYGKLLRQDYNFANGDARKRMDSLK